MGGAFGDFDAFLEGEGGQLVMWPRAMRSHCVGLALCRFGWLRLYI